MTPAARILAICKRLEHIRGALFKMSGGIEEINMMLYKIENERKSTKTDPADAPDGVSGTPTMPTGWE